jgi:hypothetical protein
MPRRKKCRHRADEEKYLLTFLFIGRFGEAVASWISLEANANKEPAHAFTLHTLIIAVITCGFARWAFGPIFLTDCALIRQDADTLSASAEVDSFLVFVPYEQFQQAFNAAEYFVDRHLAEVAVVANKDKDGLPRPVAWVVLRAGFIGNAELVSSLQEFVVSRLPNYKRPRRVEFVSELPKTATGKIQRFKLRQASLDF